MKASLARRIVRKLRRTPGKAPEWTRWICTLCKHEKKTQFGIEANTNLIFQVTVDWESERQRRRKSIRMRGNFFLYRIRKYQVDFSSCILLRLHMKFTWTIYCHFARCGPTTHPAIQLSENYWFVKKKFASFYFVLFSSLILSPFWSKNFCTNIIIFRHARSAGKHVGFRCLGPWTQNLHEICCPFIYS